jgi:hypothetical protein
MILGLTKNRLIFGNKGLQPNVINLREKLLNYLTLQCLPGCPLLSGLSGLESSHVIFA